MIPAFRIGPAIGLAVLLLCCSQNNQPSSPSAQKAQDKEPTLEIDYEKYELDNGLEVVLHQDSSDPIVAVAILFHVGSGRETKGRTGFAHLFEHMLFQQSQHVAQDQFFKKIQDAGGTLNGGTFEDGTIYFEVVPKNALEMVLWLESDRMGWLLSTVTQEAFDNQKAVVQNEKRQRVDNRPYGHTSYVIEKNLYPDDHPYNWQVIGSLQDIGNATLKDIHEFFTYWYGPNNATLAIAGDFDRQQTKEWVEKYFGEITSANEVADPQPKQAGLTETKRVFYEDNFAKSPELNMVYPTIEQYHQDSYALDMLEDLLADGKKAPLYKVIVEKHKLAPSVSAFNRSQEIAGTFTVRVRTFPEKNLTDVEKAVFEALTLFEEEGFSEDDLNRIKAQTEMTFYSDIASVFDKAFQLASYNEYAGSPGYITQDLAKYMAVTKEDVMRVYETYIKGKPYVLSSFVPQGQLSLAAANSERFPVEEEDIEKGTSTEVAEASAMTVEQIPSTFDRTVEPPKGPQPMLSLPSVWHAELDNGLRMLGIEHRELPLVRFSITLHGGMLLDRNDKVGVANLISDVMMEGTKNKTPIELEEAINDLGAEMNMYTTEESIVLQCETLKSKYSQALALAEEILLEPRWDEGEFERIKQETVELINRNRAQPGSVADRVFDRLVYGDGNILAQSPLGTAETVQAVTMDDLKAYYIGNFSPKAAQVSIVGDISKDEAVASFKSLGQRWQGEEVSLPELSYPEPKQSAKLYFVDVPKASQSEIRVGYLALPYTDPDFYPAYVMGYKLGGSFNSVLNMILREEKGYTYGARASFDGTRYRGPFLGYSAVRSNVTAESLEIFKDSIADYKNGISDEDLSFTRNSLIKSNARRFETLEALGEMLDHIATYGLDDDYIKEREEVIRDMTAERHQALANKYLPEAMVYLVVGDAETQLAPLRELGLGEPVLLDVDGNPVKTEAPAGGQVKSGSK